MMKIDFKTLIVVSLCSTAMAMNESKNSSGELLLDEDSKQQQIIHNPGSTSNDQQNTFKFDDLALPDTFKNLSAREEKFKKYQKVFFHKVKGTLPWGWPIIWRNIGYKQLSKNLNDVSSDIQKDPQNDTDSHQIVQTYRGLSSEFLNNSKNKLKNCLRDSIDSNYIRLYFVVLNSMPLYKILAKNERYDDLLKNYTWLHGEYQKKMSYVPEKPQVVFKAEEKNEDFKNQVSQLEMQNSELNKELQGKKSLIDNLQKDNLSIVEERDRYLTQCQGLEQELKLQRNDFENRLQKGEEQLNQYLKNEEKKIKEGAQLFQQELNKLKVENETIFHQKKMLAEEMDQKDKQIMELKNKIALTDPNQVVISSKQSQAYLSLLTRIMAAQEIDGDPENLEEGFNLINAYFKEKDKNV